MTDTESSASAGSQTRCRAARLITHEDRKGREEELIMDRPDAAATGASLIVENTSHARDPGQTRSWTPHTAEGYP